MEIAKHKVVSIDYTLTANDGQVLDSSEGHAPLSFIHGIGQIIPGLEKALLGKSKGDQLDVVVPPDEGYGERNESLCQRIPKSEFEASDELELGMQFRVDTNSGPMVITIVEIEDETVTVDGNHRLAGMTLQFNVEVRDVRDATDVEIAHGHVQSRNGDSNCQS